MTKKQLVAALASTVIVTQAGVASADEVLPTDPSTPATEQVVTTTPVETSTETPVVPADPTTPSEQPSTPVTPTTPTTEAPTPSATETPVAPTKPSTDVTPPATNQTPDPSDANADVPTPAPQDDTNAGTNGDPNTSNQPKQVPPTPKQDKGSTGQQDGSPREKPQPTDQANQAGVPQVGTVSNATGQVVQNVSSEAPIQTNTGASIVSTQNGHVVLSDGSTVTPEAIGAVTNSDKTITVTKADGTKATLPHTGEATNLLSVLGAGLLGLVGLLFKKRAI